MSNFNGKLIYIAGPITAPTFYQICRNIRKAEDAAFKLLKRGWAVICPHKNTESFTGGLHRNSEVDFEAWMVRDLCILARCDAIYMLKGWEKSRGSKREHKYAKELGITILDEQAFIKRMKDEG